MTFKALYRPIIEDSPTNPPPPPLLIPRPTASQAPWLSHINALVSSCGSQDEQTSSGLKHLRSAIRQKSCISGRTKPCPDPVSPVYKQSTRPFQEGLVVLLFGFAKKLCLFLFVMSKQERNQHLSGRKIGHWVKEHEHKCRRFKKDNIISVSFMF